MAGLRQNRESLGRYILRNGNAVPAQPLNK